MERLRRLPESAAGVGLRLTRAIFPRRMPHPADWRSVLIVRPCCIGDVLQSTALVAALRRALPNVRLGYAVGAWSRPVLEHNPNLDALVDTGTVVGGGSRDPRAYLRLVRAMRAGHWDACFILERSPLFALAAWAAGIHDRIGLDSGGRGAALTIPVAVRPRRHEAQTYLDLARALGLDVDGVHTELCPSAADEAEADRALEGLTGPFVALAPAGGVNPGTSLVSKRWPPARFADLAGRLARAGLRPLLLGGPGDRALAASVQDGAADAAVSLAGRLTLTGCGAVLRRCAVFVGNDSGLMHIAAAVGTPVVGLFGPT
ncbi:MAG: glycosyltransferase family 9 protein, partial [Anaerolineae bacterium]